VAPRRGADDLSAWAAARAPDLIARAEAEAVAVLRDALVDAARSQLAPPSAKPVPAAQIEPVAGEPAEIGDAGAEIDDAGELLWAYCVLHEGDEYAVDLRGVDGRGELERIDAGGLSAVISRVPRSEFGTEPLRRNLNDLPWLERVARAHEAVLETTLPQSTLVPLRMCTLYESEDSVRRMLADQRDALLSALHGLEGRYEWSVKVIVDRERLMEAARAAIAPEDPSAAGQGEGGAYLLRRRNDRAVRDAADALRADIAERVHARLQDWAIDAVTRPAQNPELSGHQGDMVLNGAYLVERERTDDLRALVNELEEHHRPLGVRIELSGPWPPYNFVAGEE
jgi:gas vesicle protein GvpL/GvpF